MPKSAMQFMNTSSAEAMAVGVTRGITTVNTLRMALQPRLSAASHTATSTFLSAPLTYM